MSSRAHKRQVEKFRWQEANRNCSVEWVGNIRAVDCKVVCSAMEMEHQV